MYDSRTGREVDGTRRITRNKAFSYLCDLPDRSVIGPASVSTAGPIRTFRTASRSSGVTEENGSTVGTSRTVFCSDVSFLVMAGYLSFMFWRQFPMAYQRVIELKPSAGGSHNRSDQGKQEPALQIN